MIYLCKFSSRHRMAVFKSDDISDVARPPIFPRPRPRPAFF